MKKRLINLVALAGIIFIILYNFYLMFNNSNMTTSELFITYWKQYSIITVVVIIGSILYYRKY